MNILVSSNARYLPYLSVMLTSLCINNPDTNVDAYVLNSSLTDEEIDSFSRTLEGRRITIHPVRVKFSPELTERLPQNEFWSLETYYRLMITDCLPEYIDRILYLDVDMIVNGSLEELYDMDLSDYDMAVCPDLNGQTTGGTMRDIQRRMLSEALSTAEYHYFNAGMLLFNLKRMREHYSFETYLKAIEDWNYQMAAPDQDILNYVHWKHVCYVPWQKYDVFSSRAHESGITVEELRKNVVIIHYAGDKPWNNTSVHYPNDEIWWEYAKQTPIYVNLMEDFVHTAMISAERVTKSVLQATGTTAKLNEYQNLLNQSLELIKKLSSNI